jgi:hypothetical protein
LRADNAPTGVVEGGAMSVEMPKFRIADVENDLIPEGTYHMRIDKAEYEPKPKKENANPYIRTWLRVMYPDTEFTGRIVFANYPLSGSGRFRLRELLVATGHSEDFELESPDQLLGLEFKALVMIEKGTAPYPDKNIIKRHLSLF